jgi:hypothetical protein
MNTKSRIKVILAAGTTQIACAYLAAWAEGIGKRHARNYNEMKSRQAQERYEAMMNARERHPAGSKLGAPGTLRVNKEASEGRPTGVPRWQDDSRM